MLYLLALIGALASALGDALGVAAARGWHPRIALAGSIVAWGSCAPLWFDMTRRAGGSFTAPCSAWGTMAVVMSCTLAFISGDRQSRGQWVGFALIMAGAFIRGLAK